MGVNNLPRVAARQCTGRESNLRPLDHKSNALTTTLPSHPDRQSDRQKHKHTERQTGTGTVRQRAEKATLEQVILGVLVGVVCLSYDIKRRSTGQHFKHENTESPPVYTEPCTQHSHLHTTVQAKIRLSNLAPQIILQKLMNHIVI